MEVKNSGNFLYLTIFSFNMYNSIEIPLKIIKMLMRN